MSATLPAPYARPGLHPLPLVGQSYQLASAAAANTRLLNLYAQKLPAGSRSDHILKPTPGLALFATMGTGPVLTSASLAGSIWAISGAHAWRLQDDGVSAPTDLGAVGTTTVDQATSIAIGLTGVVFCVPPNAYVTDLAGAAVVQITTGTGNFPAEGANSVCYLDGYYIFSSFTGTYFFLSALLDATAFDSLDFVYVSSAVDYIERCVAHNGELWLFCLSSVQIWYDTGAADAPFQPRGPGAIIAHGMGASRTIMELDGSLFWLGVDNVVYRTQGYQAQRVSDHALEELLANYAGGYLRTISACTYIYDGHTFYALSLPNSGAGRTFVYDCEVSVWHERCSAANGLGGWTINTATLLGARLLLGDAVNGNLYHMQATIPTENGVAVPRQAVLPAVVTHGPRAFMARLEIEMEVGTADAPGSVALNWSDDGGLTWTTPRTLSTGALGATRTRVATTRLGSFRQRVLQIAASAPMTIYGVDADVPPPSGLG
jgi:hypothetical protein